MRIEMAQAIGQQYSLFGQPSNEQDPPDEIPIPVSDNSPEALRQLLQANLHYRTTPWPRPYDATSHMLRLSDARDLSWVDDGSVHLIVTSPPYWTLKQYAENNAN